MPSRTYDPGEIVEVVFPYEEGAGAKRRPALVLCDQGDTFPTQRLCVSSSMKRMTCSPASMAAFCPASFHRLTLARLMHTISISDWELGAAWMIKKEWRRWRGRYDTASRA